MKINRFTGKTDVYDKKTRKSNIYDQNINVRRTQNKYICDKYSIYDINVREMNDRELKKCRRVLSLRHERRQKAMVSVISLCMAFCLLLICAVLVNSVKTNASDGFKYYTGITVEAGDTLWNLADDYMDYEHYNTKEHYITEVCAINHLDENCTITAGQLLIVPYYLEEYIR